MSKVNISKLTDTELNRLIAWFYCGATVIKDTGKNIEIMYVLKNGEYHQCAINYLADYNLAMPLAVESNLCIESPLSYEGGWWAHSEDRSACGKELLRAICSVLVMIKLEEKRL